MTFASVFHYVPVLLAICRLSKTRLPAKPDTCLKQGRIAFFIHTHTAQMAERFLHAAFLTTKKRCSSISF